MMYVRCGLFFLSTLLLASPGQAYSLLFSAGQSHYRYETDQTGISSDYLFKPGIAIEGQIVSELTRFQDLGLKLRYMSLALEDDNVPLPVEDENFDFLQVGFFYNLWFNNGFAMQIGGGSETTPYYVIEGASVNFDQHSPYYGLLGVLWRAKNQISTLEFGYTYSNYFFSSTDLEDASGFSSDVYFLIDFGRDQSIRRSAEVYYIDHNFEGNWGIKFTYRNATLSGAFEQTIDERRIELYYRFKFNQEAFY